MKKMTDEINIYLIGKRIMEFLDAVDVGSAHKPKDPVDGQSQENHAQYKYEKQLIAAEFSQTRVERFKFYQN